MVSNSNNTIETNYQRYINETNDDISSILKDFGCQPILFVGSGLTKRYINAPNWDELLGFLADQCSLVDKGLGYYKQTYDTHMQIGEEFANKYREWAWSTGHNDFPEEMFEDGVSKQAYLKFKIADYLSSLTQANKGGFSKNTYSNEIKALGKIRPHSIITTNYDQMLEVIFPDHEPIIGQKILKGQQVSVGEIFKIHGCVTEFESLVFTQSDYDVFAKKKKFLSAKLLTFFNEHPLIFIGYSATDPNIKSILADIDEALPEKGGIIPNVYILEWNDQLDENSKPPKDKLISTEEDRSIRVKLIQAADFTWVFDAFAANPALQNVSPRVLRSLIARSYHLVRHDIPKITIEADFKMLNESVESNADFAKLFGIANIQDYSAASATHRFSITEIGKKLGGSSWHIAKKLINQIKDKDGVDIEASDNKYCRAEKVNTSIFRKYSQDAFELLQKVKDDEPYDIDLGLN